MGLYIETHIRADLDELWARTQDPARHQRWDLRFTEIAYLPRAEGAPQRFRYATRVLPFLTVSGTGVAAGEKERPDGTRTSALRFASRTPSSLIAEGSGYWRYRPRRPRRPLPHRLRLPPPLGTPRRPRRPPAVPPPDGLGNRLVLRPAPALAGAGITPERALANWLAELAVRALVLAGCLTGLVGGSLPRPARPPRRRHGLPLPAAAGDRRLPRPVQSAARRHPGRPPLPARPPPPAPARPGS